MNKIYNIILVDDEDEVRGRIASKIGENTDFKIIGSAGNGYDAIELLEENDVDVVMTDIQMPFINGIELTRIIRRDYPRVKVVFITGYDEFNYAKEAVSLRVNSYMMKPITSDEINNFLSKLKQELDDEYKQMQDVLLIKEKYDALIPVIGDSYLTSLMHLNQLSLNDIEKLVLYGIEVDKHSQFITCIVEIDSEKSLMLKEIEQFKINTNEIFKKIFQEADFRHSLLVADGLILIFSFKNMSKNKIDELMNELNHSTTEFLGVSLKIGVSKIFNDFRDFPSSYRYAKRAIECSCLYDFGNIVFYEELYDSDLKQSFLNIDDYSTFSQSLQYGSDEKIEDLIKELKNRLNSSQQVFIRDYVIIDLASLLLNLSEQAKTSINEIVGLNLIEELSEFDNYFEMLDWVYEILLKIKIQDNRKQLSHTENITKKAMDYITQNYDDVDLSLEKLSSQINVSISHLSMLFKKNSGVTFSKYLINVRINKAKELLDTTQLKIVDISEKVGYKDVYYFSHSFKKVTGVSPREYRNYETIQEL